MTIMQLVPIGKNGSGHFYVNCVGCGKLLNTQKHKVYADIDGIPFVDFYCEECANAKG